MSLVITYHTDFFPLLSYCVTKIKNGRRRNRIMMSWSSHVQRWSRRSMEQLRHVFGKSRERLCGGMNWVCSSSSSNTRSRIGSQGFPVLPIPPSFCRSVHRRLGAGKHGRRPPPIRKPRIFPFLITLRFFFFFFFFFFCASVREMVSVILKYLIVMSHAANNLWASLVSVFSGVRSCIVCIIYLLPISVSPTNWIDQNRWFLWCLIVRLLLVYSCYSEQVIQY